MTLVDANVILDVLTDDKNWGAWSREQLTRLGKPPGELIVNEFCYAELSVRATSPHALDSALKVLSVRFEPTPKEALFEAAKAFLRYRSSGGPRTTILPDFFIGAHAAVLGRALLTRDTRRFRTYFPDVELITP